MAIGRTNAGAGGSGGVNFKVVGGTTEPASPKENTIWVSTSDTITGWAFSVTEPESPVEGMVWISTGTSSTVAFNALKKNTVQVYPISAKQYIDGEWVSVEAKSYQGDQWVDWWDNSSLYKEGNEFAAITGGWDARGWELRSIYTAKAPTLEKQGDSMVATITGSKTSVSGVVEILKNIDITPYKTLSIEYMGSGVNYSYFFTLGVADRDAQYYSDNALAKANPVYDDGASEKVVANLDISEINQSVDVYIGLHLTSAVSGTNTLTIYRVWLE